MLLSLLYGFILNIFLVICGNAQTYAHTLGEAVKIKDLTMLSSIMKPITTNLTYIDRSENVVRVPNISKNIKQDTKKKKTKKNPKRTLQKIIKKNKSKRKIYMNRPTNAPTNAPNNDDLENLYAQEESRQRNENLSTTQANQKKKRKFHNVARNPMPFRHMQGKKENIRNRRSERNDILILNDLDEVEFLENEKDADMVRAHVQNHW